MDRWAPGPNSGRSGGRPDGPPAGRAEGHGLDAGQWPGGSRAARCGSLGDSGRAGGRHLVTAPGSPGGRPDRPTGGPNAGQGLDGSRAVRCGSLGGFGRVNGRHLVPGRTTRRADSGPPEGHGLDAWQRPGSSRAVRCGSLGGSGRADGRASGHGSGQSAGRPDGPPAGRAEGHGAGAGQWPDSSRAVRCGSLGGSGRVDGLAPGHHGSRRSGGRPGGPPAGRTLTRCRAAPAQCAAAPWGGSGVAYVSRSDTISARTVLQIRPRRRILGGSWRCAVS